MGSSSGFAKTLIIPASVALIIYLLFSYLILPFLRHHHQRYSQYLPLHTISAHTSSLRDRLGDAVMRFFLPASWRPGAHMADHETISIDEEEGEIMVGMSLGSARREALERQRSPAVETQSRLSRDLEEGFIDDSDEDDGDGRGRAGGRRY